MIRFFSDKCPHCGAPVKPDEISPVQKPPPEVIGDGTMKCIDCKSIFEKVYDLCPKCGFRNKVIANPGENLPKEVDTSGRSSPNDPAPRYLQRGKSAKCPTCGSTNIEKIKLRKKVGIAGLVGIFSVGYLSKTFKCENCSFTLVQTSAGWNS